MKEIVENITKIAGTPYKVGAKVTILEELRIGNKIYEKGDILIIAEIHCLDEYYGQEMQIDNLSENSYKFFCILTDGENKSEETTLDCFIVGEQDSYDLDIFDSFISIDSKATKKAKMKESLRWFIPILIFILALAILGIFINSIDITAVVIFLAIIYVVGYCFVMWQNFTSSDYCDKAKIAIEMSFTVNND
ncbi:MAG: hypothetical protein NC485_10315 [Ruminococcus flavefaciens]|nr:hypothetical protein [Ruminococcus flavefaciens]MCM1059291.1 hypothetical protein [Eubacterium sp.]